MGLLLDFPLALVVAVVSIASASGPHDDPVERSRWMGKPAIAAAAIAAQSQTASAEIDGEAWLAAVKFAGADAGLEAEAARIFVTSSGRAYVPIASERAAILALRGDPARVAAIAYARAARHYAEIATLPDIEPSVGLLAAADRIGSDAAVELQRLATTEPGALLATRMPDISSRYPALAFGPRHARTTAEAMAHLQTSAVAALRASLAASLEATREPSELLARLSRSAAATRVAGWVTAIEPATTAATSSASEVSAPRSRTRRP